MTIENELLTRVASGATTAFILQWMKGKRWAFWINYDTEVLNRISSAIIALITSTGILATFHAGVLQISGLTFENAGHFIWSFWTVWTCQYVVYRLAIAPPAPGVVQDSIRRRRLFEDFPEAPE